MCILSGLVFSLILSLSGIFAFTAHMYFLKKGQDEFKSTTSLSILVSTMVLPLVQACLTIVMLLN
ncbi:MAG: DUF6713 family protein [Halobacteriota archaeon]